MPSKGLSLSLSLSLSLLVHRAHCDASARCLDDGGGGVGGIGARARWRERGAYRPRREVSSRVLLQSRAGSREGRFARLFSRRCFFPTALLLLLLSLQQVCDYVHTWVCFVLIQGSLRDWQERGWIGLFYSVVVCLFSANSSSSDTGVPIKNIR